LGATDSCEKKLKFHEEFVGPNGTGGTFRSVATWLSHVAESPKPQILSFPTMMSKQTIPQLSNVKTSQPKQETNLNLKNEMSHQIKRI
jgi:hypothetical protein